MSKVKLVLNKDINYNANLYFNKAKKLKNKIPGLNIAIENTQKEIKNFSNKKEEYLKTKIQKDIINKSKKKEWFDTFRSTRTSSNLLFVIGKDSGSNEVLIKKHLEENDLVFHTQAPGSPFGILKNAKSNYNKTDLEESATFLSSFSSQWKKGFGTADAFWVYSDQISKKAQSGEYISKGSFMIYGEKNIIKNVILRLGIGTIKKQIKHDENTLTYYELFSGHEKSCLKHCDKFIRIEPGDLKYKTLNKEIKKQLKVNLIEDLPKLLPNDCKIVKK